MCVCVYFFVLPFPSFPIRRHDIDVCGSVSTRTGPREPKSRHCALVTRPKDRSFFFFFFFYCFLADADVRSVIDDEEKEEKGEEEEDEDGDDR